MKYTQWNGKFERNTAYVDVDMKVYHDWLQNQQCDYCGAKYSEKHPEAWWATEWDCGCRFK